MPSRAAIALFGSPSASSSSTWTSRGVSGSSNASSLRRRGRGRWLGDQDGIGIDARTRAPPPASRTRRRLPSSRRPASQARRVHRPIRPGARAFTASPNVGSAFSRTSGPLNGPHVRLFTESGVRRPSRSGPTPRRRAARATHVAADAIADQQIQQILGRPDGVAVELEQHVADEHAGGRRRTPARHADDQQRFLASVAAALILRQRDRLTGDAEVTALQTGRARGRWRPSSTRSPRE